MAEITGEKLIVAAALNFKLWNGEIWMLYC